MRPLLFILLALLAPGGAQASSAASNQLAGHPSPYLALHAGDPVHWQSWQAGVFEQARVENRLVLVSVGYFACHWCHVMQRESYQNPATAGILNRRFLSVKIDRELEPDLDRRLIQFVEQVRGAAGWPLNVFITPEGYPLTGFTYLPPDQFLELLHHLDDEWQQNHVALSASARAFFESGLLDATDQRAPQDPGTATLVEEFIDQAMRSADMFQGGFGDTSKFPNVPQLDALLDSVGLGQTTDPEVTEFIQLSLQAMTSQNLQDHVNGGFFRYTTDPDWQTPHFEKMLYDNAMLAALYLKGHRLWPGQGYADSALRTLDFIEASLKHPQGGYMASLSAVDTNSREGGAYLWSDAQLESLLDAEQQQHLRRHWQRSSINGDFLLRPRSMTANAARSQLDRSIRQKLRAGNGQRMPADDKRLASWNAMMLQALTLAADRHPRYAERARQLYARMLELFFVEGELIRLAGNAGAADAVFEDYAETASAFLNYARRFDDRDALQRAQRLVEEAQRRFLQQDRWQPKAQPLIPIAQGKWIIEDLVLYSPMTLWLRTALKLPDIGPGLRENAEAMLLRVSPSMIARPYYYASFILLRSRFES